mgnify:CR=1 FL=1
MTSWEFGATNNFLCLRLDGPVTSRNPAIGTFAADILTDVDMYQRLSMVINPPHEAPPQKPMSLGVDLEAVPATDRPAAVLVPLMQIGNDWHVLLTKRASHLAHHAGQISFPGGKQEPEDDGPGETALREAFEEIGLMPENVQVAGWLDRVRSPAGFIVQPVVGVVGGIDSLDGLQADPAEVDVIFTLPVAHVINRDNFKLVPRETNGRRNDYWIVAHHDHLIWGLSARILNDLQQRLLLGLQS